MEIGERPPFDNYELLHRNFPPPTRPELEAQVLRFRDVLSAYYNRLMTKVREILYSTRIHERLVTMGPNALLVRGSLLLEEANFERFRLIFRVLDDDDNHDFELYAAVQEGYETLMAALEEMGKYAVVTAESRVFSLLRVHIEDADAYREDMLMIFGDYLNYYLRALAKLNPRWSYPGEPLFFWEDALDNATHPSAETSSTG